MLEILKKWGRWFSKVGGLDFHILQTLIYRGWSVIAGILTVFLVPTFLEPVEQGYYYTFASIIALQIFFELGISQVIVQLVAHDAAHFSWDGRDRIEGNNEKIIRVTYLINVLKKWYRIIAILFFLLVGAGGSWFFESQHELARIKWFGPWLFVLFCTGVNLYWSPLLAVVEGCGLVGSVAKLRLRQSVVGSVCVWVALWGGAGLWSVIFLPLISSVMSGIWLSSHKNIVSQLSKRQMISNQIPIDWFVEVFPFQWRIAVSWISGYFIFQLFTPVVFRTQGAIEAGKLGVSLSIFSAISSVGMSWISAKVPAMASLIAKNKRLELNSIFKAVLLRTSSFVAFACVSFVFMTLLADVYFPAVRNKLASSSILILLALVTITNSFVFCAAAYMRAHKEEPMLFLSVVCGLLTVAAVYAGSKFNTELTVGAYAAVAVFISLPWTVLIFRRYWSK